METIAFYSYKGGPGRSLLVSSIAEILAQGDKSVFVLDFDLEAPGLHHKFKIPSEKIRRGVVDYILSGQSQHELPNSIKKYTVTVTLGMNRVIFMPAGNAPSENYAYKLSEINWYKLFYIDKIKQGEKTFDD